MSSYVLWVRSWSFLMITCLYPNLGTSHHSPLFCIFLINFQFCVFHCSCPSLHFLEHFSSFSNFAFSSALAHVCILLSTSHKFPIHRVSMQKSVFRDNLLRSWWLDAYIVILALLIDSPLFHAFSTSISNFMFSTALAKVCIFLSTSRQFLILRSPLLWPKFAFSWALLINFLFIGFQCRKVFSEVICYAQLFLVNQLAISWLLFQLFLTFSTLSFLPNG